MIGLVAMLVIILIAITVFLQDVDVRAYGSEHISIAISLTLFSLELKNVLKSRRKRKHKFTKSLRIASFLTKLGSLLVKRATVNVKAYRPFSLEALRRDAALTAVAVSSPIFILYLKRNAMCYLETGESTNDVDVTFSFSLGALFISFVKASYYTLKSMLKRRIRNA